MHKTRIGTMETKLNHLKTKNENAANIYVKHITMGKKEFDFSELIEGVSNQTGLGTATVRQVLDSTRALMANHLANNADRRVEFHNLFIIEMEEKPATHWNINGKSGTKPAHFKVKMKPHSGFLRAINDNLPPDSPLKATK